jgi:chloride channel protein, CIC family
MWWPALGGLAIGVGGLFQGRALGVGYSSIDALLLAQLGVGVVLSLLLVKAIIWSISLGSGTSGGVLAPLLIIGGSLGGLFALVLPGGSVGLFVLVGMGAMIGGTMRAPFTGVVFSLELTHAVAALLPLLVAALAADAVTVLVMKRSILTEKIARRGVHVSREYSVDPLEHIQVHSVMRTHLRSVSAGLSVEEVLENTSQPDAGEIGVCLIDDGGKFSGFLSRSDLRKFIEVGGDPRRPAVALAPKEGPRVYPDQPMRFAADALARVDGLAVPVVERGDPSSVVGFVTRETPFEARLLYTESEVRRERLLESSTLNRWWTARAPPRR